jgi:Protease inhibitor Inh
VDRKGRLKALGAASFALVGLTGAGPAAPADPARLAGAWDLALDGSHRRCRITLALDEGPAGRALRFPAGCRRALPVLNSAGGWLVPANGTVRLLDKQGEPALEFEARDEILVAHAKSGEIYHLERQEKAAEPGSTPAPIPAGLGAPQLTPIDPAKAPAFWSLPGTYVIDRYSEREVCRLGLTSTMVGAGGRFEAVLLDGCRDPGLLVFNPAAWRYEGGRLILTARRGHEVTLVSEREGQWRRDPEVGATLVLRKAPGP